MFTITQIFGSVGIGLVVVPFASLLKKEHWDARLKFLAALLVSLVFSVGGLYVQGTIHNYRDVITNAAIVFTAATTFFKLYFGGTSLEPVLAAVGTPRFKKIIAATSQVTDQVDSVVDAVPAAIDNTVAAVAAANANAPLAVSGVQAANGVPPQV